MIEQAYQEFGDALVVANSLGKDSCAVWHLAKRVSQRVRGFIVTTRFKPAETKRFMKEEVAQGEDERAGRWIGTSKCSGECGIHTKPLVTNHPIREASHI